MENNVPDSISRKGERRGGGGEQHIIRAENGIVAGCYICTVVLSPAVVNQGQKLFLIYLWEARLAGWLVGRGEGGGVVGGGGGGKLPFLSSPLLPFPSYFFFHFPPPENTQEGRGGERKIPSRRSFL